jgi:protein ImuB
MVKRFVSIWFRHLTTDWFTIRQPELSNTAFVLSAPSHGRMMIVASNAIAESKGVYSDMVLADARALVPSLLALDDKPDLPGKLLIRLAEWCIRFTPVVAVDPPDGLILDVTGCSHLWGGDELYLRDIIKRLKSRGYHVRASMADTIGAAWAVARFSNSFVIESGHQVKALLSLPPASLRIETEIVERLEKLGLRQIKDFIGLPRTVLRRRFGKHLIQKLNQAIGEEEEIIQPFQPIEPYQDRLPCLEPIVTATGIEIALQRLLEMLCHRMQQEQKGLRKALFKSYCIDGRIEILEIGTNRPTHNARHIFKLLENKLSSIEPRLGIELFVLEAPVVEEVNPLQEKLWETHGGGLHDIALSELLDRLAGKLGPDHIHRYVPGEHYWPERSIQLASSLDEEATTEWKVDRPRPVQLLSQPELIQVTAPIPDYPPMNFRYKGELHKIAKADGPERIEQEWWIAEGKHRDYYCVEDEEGHRYWLFRSGHYSDKTYQWFIHGFFA